MVRGNSTASGGRWSKREESEREGSEEKASKRAVSAALRQVHDKTGAGHFVSDRFGRFGDLRHRRRGRILLHHFLATCTIITGREKIHANSFLLFFSDPRTSSSLPSEHESCVASQRTTLLKQHKARWPVVLCAGFEGVEDFGPHSRLRRAFAHELFDCAPALVLQPTHHFELDRVCRRRRGVV